MLYLLSELNQMNREQFVSAMGDIFEHTPSIAAQAWESQPFQDVADLHQKMVTVMYALSPEAKRALICAHPDLGGKAQMAAASVQEQAGVGLNRLTSEEYERFHRLNQAYKDKFSFPFIIAVKNHTKESILAAFDRRLENSGDVEMRQALAEIAQIAQFRIRDRVSQS